MTILFFIFIIEIFDGKEITETSRQFLRNWHASKEVQKKKREEIFRKGTIGDFSNGDGIIILLMYCHFSVSLPTLMLYRIS